MSTPGIFDEQKLSWKGRDYVIPAGRVLGCIAEIENVLTLHEMIQWALRGTVPASKLAQAYAAALRYAGCDVTANEVYADGLQTLSPEQMQKAVQGLLTIMVPRDQQHFAGDKKPGKDQAVTALSGMSRAATSRSASSKKRSSQQNSGRSRRTKSGGGSKV